MTQPPAQPTSPARTPTAVDAVANAYVREFAALDPITATDIGIAGYDDQLPDLSPDWLESMSALRRRTLDELAATEAVDSSDRITVAAMRDALTLVEQIRATGREESDLANIASPLQNVRDTFDLMPTATADNWATVARRLAAVPEAIAGYVASLRLAASRGQIRPVRQVRAGIVQAERNVSSDGFFATYARDAAPDSGDLPDSLRTDLTRGAQAAAQAYVDLISVLREELLPAAPEADPVGREIYQLQSRQFLGAQVDLDETYAWGQAEVERITAEMHQTADRIKPGASVDEAIDALNRDPARKLSGTAALQQWMQATSDAAVAALADTHFDIPPAIRTLECRIAPTTSGVIYYTGPSDDLVTRPGQMWWSVPEGVTEFSTWGELSTVYHEGVPGHHLQVAQTMYRRDMLNDWRRLLSWTSGHGEGWALYAERLMAELGYLEDPANYLGLLDSQSLRAARVVIDIGVHCGLTAPDEVGGGEWTYDKGWQYLSAHCHSAADETLRFELERYLGWPGQAPSYKIGERYWLQLREDVRAAEGDAFDLKAFHRRALDVGSLGLDVLRRAVLGEFD